MQQLIRDTGNGTMDKAVYETFVSAKETGGLLKPEQPGNVIARVVASPPKELSGKFTRSGTTGTQSRKLANSCNSWNSPDLAAYQE